MKTKARPPKGAGPEAPTPDSSSGPDPDTAPPPGRGSIYVVRGRRPTQYGPETYSVIRRNLPAAHRAAAQMDAKGYGPATIHGVFVRRWHHIPRGKSW